MAAIDFPSSPTSGQIFVGGNGVVYTYNGTLWLATGASAGGDFFATGTGGAVSTGAAATVIPNTVISGNSTGSYSTSTGRYTPPAGRFSIYGYVCANVSAAGGGLMVYLFKNGTVILNAQTSNTVSTAGGATTPAVEITADANGTDYFELRASVGSATATVFTMGFGAYPISGIKGPPGDLVTATGVIVDFAGSTAPSGWLICDGASYTTAAQAALFAVIGYTYGGSGSNFNVPDLGGRVTAGKEATATRLTVAGAGFSGATLGAAGGTQTHTLTIAQLAAHTHPNSNETFTPSGGVQAGGDYNLAHGVSGATGTDQAHQNTQPTMVMNKIIKT